MNSFRHYRNEVTKTIRLAKKSHIDELSDKLETDNLNSKDWWKILKSFIKPNVNSTIPPLSENGIVYSSDKNKADLLNEYFAGQSQLDDDRVNLPDQNINDNLPILQTIQITPAEVKDILQNLKLGKSSF